MDAIIFYFSKWISWWTGASSASLTIGKCSIANWWQRNWWRATHEMDMNMMAIRGCDTRNGWHNLILNKRCARSVQGAFKTDWTHITNARCALNGKVLVNIAERNHVCLDLWLANVDAIECTLACVHFAMCPVPNHCLSSYIGMASMPLKWLHVFHT